MREAIDPTEAAQLERARSGDRAAFGELVNLYSARIYTHLFRLVQNREEAEDLAQETFVRAFRCLGQYDASRPLRNWLYAIATNVGLNGLRSKRRRLPVAREPEKEAVDEGADVRRQVERNETVERLSALLERLPARSAALIHLHYREGFAVAEAAELLGITETAAKVALHRARQRLREWLIEDEQK